jgi:hypothetical protein
MNVERSSAAKALRDIGECAKSSRRDGESKSLNIPKTVVFRDAQFLNWTPEFVFAR